MARVSADADSAERRLLTNVNESNRDALADGDSVMAIMGLKVKGSSVPPQRGTLIKKIQPVDGADEIECNADQVRGLVLKT